MPATSDCPRQPGPPAGAAHTPAGTDWLAQARAADAVPTVVSIPVLAPGTRAGGYRLERQLGAGGMGTVWEAVDDGGTHVAMKILHPAIAADPAARQRLAREAAVLARVRDPRVARVLDVETGEPSPDPGPSALSAPSPAVPAPTASSPTAPAPASHPARSAAAIADLAFVVTELVDGPTLQAEVDGNGPYDLTQDREPFRELVSGVVGALEAVHAAGVVHRDLKPSNVMLGPAGPVLIDFGIAQVAGDARLTMTGQVTGTPGFIPPEVLSGASPDAGADWFALAGVLLFTLTGRPPFGSGDWQAVFHRVYAGQPELGDLPARAPVLAATLAAALSPDPARRLPLREILPLLDGEASPASLPSPTPSSSTHSSPTLSSPALSSLPPTYPAGTTAALPTAQPAALPTTALPAAYSPDATTALPADEADLASTTVLPPTYPATSPADAPTASPATEATTVYPPALASTTPAQPAFPADPQQAPFQASPAQVPFPPSPGPTPPPGSRRHSGVVLAAGTSLVAAGTVWPVPVMTLVTLWLLASGTRGRASRAAWRRLMQTGETTRPLRTWLTMPWYLARAAAAAASSALLGWAAAALLTWAGGTGATDPIGIGARMSAALTAARWEGAVAATATLAFLLLTWLAPWNGPARRASAAAVERVAPGSAGRSVLALACLAAAGATALAWWRGLLPAPDLSALLQVLASSAH